MKKSSPKYLALGAGVAAFASILGGGAFAASALGSSASNTASVTSQTSSPAADATAKADHTAQQEAFVQALASNLGIDEATLKAALQKTSLAEIAQMVTDGKLTQAQADTITAAVQSGDNLFAGLNGGPRGGGPGDHGGPGGPGGPGFGDRAADDSALATFLGIDTATLQTELQSGSSLATVATSHGKTRDELKAFLTSEQTADLAAAVTAGKLTQAQADKIAADQAANIDARIDGTFTGDPGMRGGHGGPPPTSGSTTAPTTN